MPLVKYYEVTQTRVVKVQANNEVDACRIASTAFDMAKLDDDINTVAGPEGVWGRTIGAIEVTDLNIRKEL